MRCNLKTLYDECVEALSPNLIVWDIEKSKEYFSYIRSKFKFEAWGQISLNSDFFMKTNDFFKIYDYFNSLDLCNEKCYLITIRTEYPIFETDCQNLLLNKDDVFALSHGIFIILPNSGLILEIWNEEYFSLVKT